MSSCCNPLSGKPDDPKYRIYLEDDEKGNGWVAIRFDITAGRAATIFSNPTDKFFTIEFRKNPRDVSTRFCLLPGSQATIEGRVPEDIIRIVSK